MSVFKDRKWLCRSLKRGPRVESWFTLFYIPQAFLDWPSLAQKCWSPFLSPSFMSTGCSQEVHHMDAHDSVACRVFIVLNLVTSMVHFSLSSQAHELPTMCHLRPSDKFYLNQAHKNRDQLDAEECVVLAFAGLWLKSSVGFWFMLMRSVSSLWQNQFKKKQRPIVFNVEFILQFNEGLPCIFGYGCHPRLLNIGPN